MPRNPDVPCAGCGKLIWRGRSSLPPGQARCWSCRRLAAGRGPDDRVTQRAWTPQALTCPACTQPFVQSRHGQKYCAPSCRERHHGQAGHRWRTATKASTTARGYGNEHMKARRAAAATHNPSDPCVRCGAPLGPMGPWLHLDHTADRRGYLGFAHARCNRRAGARAGRQRQRRG